MRVDHHTAKRSPKGVTGTAWTLAEDALLRARVNAEGQPLPEEVEA